MANVSLRHVYKIYDGGVTAVTDFNLEIADKEFIILVGPSGCGKSTTLRMIAGLEDISKGELYIGDTLANDVAPKDRDIAMVFQNYALYPHMTVYDNMAFGLKLRKFSKEEIKRRVEEAARILGIEQYLDRKPKALSGGQRQRVALGRAIVRNPKVFLLDEPLSNLDAKLRAQMRTEISKIYQRLGTTFIYVTHDQTEAMTMGTRIVVMKDGFIQQVDTPQHLYDMPCNMFVAGFIGSPQMNFINAVLSKNGGKYTLDFDKYHVPVPESKVNADLDNYVGKEVVLGIRPEHVHDEPEEIAKAECLLKANVDVTELMGAEIYLYVEGLEDEEALQGYFMARMSKYVQSKGKEAMGWDELTNTRIPDGAIIYGWRGYGQAAVKAAEQGHRFVMTPARIMYLIRYQGPQWFEPLTYFGNNTLKDVYRYEPIQKEWSPEVRSLLMGVQASMWTEFCNKPEDVEYQLFPRLAALAEVAWTQPWHKNWRSFLVAMDKFNEHLSAKGIVFACSMYNIQHTVTPVNGKLQVKLECERPDVEIRYTMDGKEPTDRSLLYKSPLVVTGTQTIKCTTYRAGRQMGKTLTLPLVWNKATAKPVLGNTQAGKILVNGIRGSLRQSDFEWHSWESSDSVAFTIDLQKKESLRSVSVGCITNYGMAAHKPADIEVWVSNDNRDYRKVSGKQFTDGEIFREGTFKEDVVLDLNKEIGRYVRIIAKGAGECPATHVRPGQEARIYFDEVMIE